MRIFSSLALSLHVERNPGYWLSKRQATTVSRRLQRVLELTEHQRQIVHQYLIGINVEGALDVKFTPRDAEAVKGFMQWYEEVRSTTLTYLVANLNTGAICVFIHGGWKPYTIDVKKLFSTQ